MFSNSYQSGFLSILYAGGAKPLSIWCQKVKNGHIRRVTDEDVQTLAVELMGTNVATTYIVCPDNPKQTLGIRLPFFVMIVKNMKKYFTFEITIMGSSYTETLRVQIHANVRIRRIYFSDRLYAEDEMPAEFKLYVPISTTRKKPKVPPKQVEDKGTGRDIIPELVAADEEAKAAAEGDIIPSGAPPSPMETPHVAEAAPVEGDEAAAPEGLEGEGEEGEEGDEGAEGEEQYEAASEAPSEGQGEEGEGPAEGDAEGAEEAASEAADASELPSETPTDEAPAEEAADEPPAAATE